MAARWIVNWLFLAAALAVFSTGLVLLLGFHVGHGATASAAFGIGRLTWLNVHRLTSVLTAITGVVHAWQHRRALVRVLAGAVRAGTRSGGAERVMYAAFLVAVGSGLVAWLLLDGSFAPLGPVEIARASPARHPWIDAHHLSSLLSLGLLVRHVVRRRRGLIRRRE